MPNVIDVDIRGAQGTGAVPDAETEQSLLVSYLTLRRIVGGLGIGLPVLLALVSRVFEGHWLQPSISAYYDLNHPRDVFVGVLVAIGFFLLTYRGYERADDIAGYLSFVFALGVALLDHDDPIVGNFHLTSAALLFLTFAYYAFFLFTKTRGVITPEKRTRNVVYRLCAVIIVLCLLAIAGHALYAKLNGQDPKNWAAVFWLESLMLWAFGFSWVVKGETLWRDAGLPPALKPAERRLQR